MPPKDGGPAFARARSIEPTNPNGPGYVEHPAQEGLSLRDWFAGQAMVGLLNTMDQSGPEMAESAYLFADEMLKAREAE